MQKMTRGAAIATLLATASSVLAQPPGGRGGPGGRAGPAGGRGGRGGRGGAPAAPSLMTYEMAATAMAAAEAHAAENGWLMTIRIVDQSDNVVMVHRMQDANPFTAGIAERKTLTVIGSKMTSAEYGMKIEAGEIEAIENAVTFGGGVPVYIDGELVGAIAASGAAPEEDEQVSRAGVAAIGGSVTMN